MSTPDVAEAPIRSRRERVPVWLDRVVRVALLLILLAGTVGAVLPRLASPASVAQLNAGLASGQVRGALVQSGGPVRWTSDWWRWRSTQLPGGAVDDEAWLRARAAESGRDVQVDWAGTGARRLLSEPPWLPLRLAVLGAGIATFVIMLARRRRWLADRVGWCWLITGGLGAPVYLLLEPEPLWASAGRRPRWSRWRRLPVSGLAGFLIGWIGVGAVWTLADLVRMIG